MCVLRGNNFNREENHRTCTNWTLNCVMTIMTSQPWVSEKPSAFLKQVTGVWITINKLRCRRPCFQLGLWRWRSGRTQLEKQSTLWHKGWGEGITSPWNPWPGELYHPHVSKAAGYSQASLDQEDLFVYLRQKEVKSSFQHLMYSMIMLYFSVPSTSVELSRRKAQTRLSCQVTK